MPVYLVIDTGYDDPRPTIGPFADRQEALRGYQKHKIENLGPDGIEDAYDVPEAQIDWEKEYFEDDAFFMVEVS